MTYITRRIVYTVDDQDYELTVEQADTCDAKSAEFPLSPEGDIEFNNWFRDFLKTNNIRPMNKRMAKYWTNINNSSDDTIKHALTGRAMQSVVSVVDPKNRPVVRFKENAQTSYWHDNEVTLPTFPVKEAATVHDAINRMTGFAIHEADHSKYTRPLIDVRLRDFIERSPFNMNMANLLEDEKNNVLEVENNPGFERYLKDTYDYLWNRDKDKVAKLPPFSEANLHEKIAALATGVQRPNEALDYLDKSWHPVIEKARPFVQSYVELGKKATSGDIRETVMLLKDILKVTPQEELEAQRDPQQQQKAPQLTPCSATHGDEGLEVEDAVEVEGLINEELEKVFDPHDKEKSGPLHSMLEGVDLPPSFVRRPRVLHPSAMPKADGLIQKAVAAINLRRAAPKADERFMTSGEVDEDELYRLFGNDHRVFRDITEEVVPSAAVYLIVDCSGSMIGGLNRTMGMTYAMDRTSETFRSSTKLGAAQKMAYLLVKAMQSKPNVRVRVLGQTGDNMPGFNSSAIIYRIWEEGDPINRLSTIMTVETGSTYDSPALAWAGQEILNEQVEQRLIIVLSDGHPEGMSGYGGTPARRHVRKIVDSLSKKGVAVMNLSLDTELADSEQEMMYGKNYVGAISGPGLYSHLLSKLSKVLERVSRT